MPLHPIAPHSDKHPLKPTSPPIMRLHTLAHLTGPYRTKRARRRLAIAIASLAIVALHLICYALAHI